MSLSNKITGLALTGLLCAGLNHPSVAKDPEERGGFVNLANPENRKKLLQMIAAMDKPARITEVTIAGDGLEGDRVYASGTVLSQSSQDEASREMARVLERGVLGVMDNLNGPIDPRGPYHVESARPFGLTLQSKQGPHERFEVLYNLFLTPKFHRMSECALHRISWPKSLQPDPSRFTGMQCTLPEPKEDKPSIEWAVFADFPHGSKPYLLGDQMQFPGELNVENEGHYWFVLGGFSVSGENLTIALSSSETELGTLNTVYAQSGFSEGSRHASYTTRPGTIDTEAFYADLKDISAKAPRSFLVKGGSNPAMGSYGAVHQD